MSRLLKLYYERRFKWERPGLIRSVIYSTSFAGRPIYYGIAQDLSPGIGPLAGRNYEVWGRDFCSLAESTMKKAAASRNKGDGFFQVGGLIPNQGL